MENASKALLIAAEVLIAILVASIFALLFSTASDYSRQYEATRQSQEIQAFNTKFTNYIKYTEDGNPNSTAQDVVSVINLANYYNGRDNLGITVRLIGVDGTYSNLQNDTGKIDEFINRYTDPIRQTWNYDGAGTREYEDYRFSGTITPDNEGRVQEITFRLESTKVLITL